MEANEKKNQICKTKNKQAKTFEFPRNSCFFCGGFYGPCFNEPVCLTCHAFVFPDDLSCQHLSLPMFSEKREDGDSGNDEPIELFALYSDVIDCDDIPNNVRVVSAGPCYPRYEKTILPHSSSQRMDVVARHVALLSNPRKPNLLKPGIIDSIPPEVLLVVFSYLDDFSLWSVSHVCRRWQNAVLATEVSNERWGKITRKRWPLFNPLFPSTDWYKMFTKLVESAPCKPCLRKMSLRKRPVKEENTWRKNRLKHEIRNIKSEPLEGIRLTSLDNRQCHWQASIVGPTDSPYEGGLFYLYVQVPYGYPMCPPIVRFITKIFHPNVSRHGDVGIDSIQHNWSLALTITKILLSVQSLLTDPYCEVCMEPEIGQMYLNDRTQYDTYAREWTWKYAMHDVIMM